jgi:hypothetical protein
MVQPNVLSETIGRVLKPAGFKRTASTWFLENAEVFQVVNLQKSSFGRQYYVNVALWLKTLGHVDVPKAHQCQVQCRWGALIPEPDAKDLATLLDLEDASVGESERAAKVSHLLEAFVLPFFAGVSTLSGLRAIYQSDRLPCQVWVIAKELLAQ